ncbi:hypothetical protein BJ912DRAFT_1062828 [Pholiota molesta]|nr:hypothetical protein BJ912DRAFT_1062828 [Pholiota molesta]
MSFPRFAPTTTTTSLNSPPRCHDATSTTDNHGHDAATQRRRWKGRRQQGETRERETHQLPFTATRNRSANDDDGHHPPRRHVRPPLPSSTTTSPAPQHPSPATSPLRCPPAVTTSPTHDDAALHPPRTLP